MTTPAGSSTSRAWPGPCRTPAIGLAGWDGVLAGDVPRGAGLSSSAAVELATARAFQAVSGFPWDPAAMAQLGQKAENQWVGMNCGIMDQMISAAGEADHALLIDCRSLADDARAPAARHGRGDPGHGHPARPGRLGLQRAPRPVRGRRALLRRARAARREHGTLRGRGRRAGRRDASAAPATSSARTPAPWPRPRPCSAATRSSWAG